MLLFLKRTSHQEVNFIQALHLTGKTSNANPPEYITTRCKNERCCITNDAGRIIGASENVISRDKIYLDSTSLQGKIYKDRHQIL